MALGSLLPVPGLLLLPLTVLLMAALGVAVAALGYMPLRDRPPVAVFVSTIAIGIVLRNGLEASSARHPLRPAAGRRRHGRDPGLVLGRQSIAIVLAAVAIAVACTCC